MLYFISLGLGDAKDITVKCVEIVKRCDKVFLEHYISNLNVGKEELEKFYGREILLADRGLLE
jgi:diphthine synthase